MDESHFIKYLFVGDSSRYDFVSAICGRKVEARLNVDLLYGKDYNRDDINGKIHVESPSISPGFCFSLPADFDAYVDEHWIENYQEVFIFAEYPYYKEDVIDLFENNAITPYNTTFVLYKKKRKFGYTDLDTEDDAIRKVIEYCVNKCKKITVYDEDAPDRGFLLADYDFIHRISNEFCCVFTMNYKAFKEGFTLLYGMFVCGEMDKEQPGIFEYLKVKDCQENILDFFVDSYAKEVFTESFQNKILQLCDIYLFDLFEQKYISQIANQMYRQIKESYERHFKKKLLNKVGMIKMPDSEIGYMKMMNEKNIVSVFESQRISFFTGEQKTCKKILQKEFDAIDLLLKKANRTII